MQEHRHERNTGRRKKTAATRRAKRITHSSLLDSTVSAHRRNNNTRCRHKKQKKYVTTARGNSKGVKRHTLYTIETKSVLRLSDLLERFDSAERMELEREIVNALALNAQANYRRSESDRRSSIGTSRYPSPSWPADAAKESASGAVDDDDHELTLARNSSTPCIIVEVEYYDPSCLTEEQMRKHASSTLTIVAESRV